MQINPYLKNLFRMPWEPKSVEPPTIDPDLENLNSFQRSAESIRYSVLSIEFWLSPDGQVREWIRHHSKLALILGIPVFLLFPIVTFALWQIATWLGLLIAIAGHLLLFPITALLALLMITMVINLVRDLIGRK